MEEDLLCSKQDFPVVPYIYSAYLDTCSLMQSTSEPDNTFSGISCPSYKTIFPCYPILKFCISCIIES